MDSKTEKAVEHFKYRMYSTYGLDINIVINSTNTVGYVYSSPHILYDVETIMNLVERVNIEDYYDRHIKQLRDNKINDVLE